MRAVWFGLLASLLSACSQEVPQTMPSATDDFELRSPVASGLIASTLPELVTALENGDVTSLDLTQAYLQRIEDVDRAGPRLQSVLAVNPDALEQAQASDARREAGEMLGPLDGVPILLKDNIETLDPMPTTAGAIALTDNVTRRDSPLVAG
ncbi:MAG: amidase family protein, partial [Pseudomonadota bacterium]